MRRRPMAAETNGMAVKATGSGSWKELPGVLAVAVAVALALSNSLLLLPQLASTSPSFTHRLPLTLSLLSLPLPLPLPSLFSSILCPQPTLSSPLLFYSTTLPFASLATAPPPLRRYTQLASSTSSSSPATSHCHFGTSRYMTVSALPHCYAHVRS